jgi:hypothetical protein
MLLRSREMPPCRTWKMSREVMTMTRLTGRGRGCMMKPRIGRGPRRKGPEMEGAGSIRCFDICQMTGHYLRCII